MLLRVLLLICLLAASASAQAPERVALVVANADYAAAGRLRNPGADARLVADALRKAGFQTVEIKRDLNRRAFEDAMRAFQRRADGAQVAMLYYAGHGIESDGKNWLIPTDATLSSARELPYEAIDLDRALDAVDGAKMRIVVLDACRDNPFTRSWPRGTRSVTRGLGGLDVDNIVVIYAAAPGQTAADGEGANSPFATAVARRLPEPGLALQLLGAAVRDDVLRATGGRQRPFVSSSITAELFYMAPGIAQPTLPQPQATEGQPPVADAGRPDRAVVRAVNENLPPGVHFRDCGAAWCPELTVVAAGSFLTAPLTTGAASGNSKPPRRQVTVPRSFALMAFEVTHAEWALCVADTVCVAKPGAPREPVVNVSWLEAQAYATWLAGKTGFSYRLPLEAEWERAARAGVDDSFGLGGSSLTLCDIANIAPTDTTVMGPLADALIFRGAGELASAMFCKSRFTSLMPVGSLQPNRFGVHDLIGNASEWVADCWSEALKSPTIGASSCAGVEERVIRGGSWRTPQSGADLDKRGRGLRGLGAPDTGFRLARSL